MSPVNTSNGSGVGTIASPMAPAMDCEIPEGLGWSFDRSFRVRGARGGNRVLLLVAPGRVVWRPILTPWANTTKPTSKRSRRVPRARGQEVLIVLREAMARVHAGASSRGHKCRPRHRHLGQPLEGSPRRRKGPATGKAVEESREATSWEPFCDTF